MSRQNAEEAKSTQPASKIARERQKIHPALEITSWQSQQKALPTEKLIQALGSKKDEEEPNNLAQMGKGTLWKQEVNRQAFYNLSFHRDVFVSLSLSKTFVMQWTCLSFSPWCKSRTVQAAMQLRPPDFQLVPKWTYAELQQPGVQQQHQNRKKPR